MINRTVLSILLTLIMVGSLPAIAVAGTGFGANDTETSHESPSDIESIGDNVEYLKNGHSSEDPFIDPEIQSMADSGESGIIIVDLKPIQEQTLASADTRDDGIDLLKMHAEQSQADLIQYAEETSGLDVELTWWLANELSLQVDFSEVSIREIASRSDVQGVYPNKQIPQPGLDMSSSTGPDMDADLNDWDDWQCQPYIAEACNEEYSWKGIDGIDMLIEEDGYNVTWSHAYMNITHAWSEHDTMGEGVKIATVDTGVDIRHPDIDLYTEDPNDPTYPGGYARFADDVTVEENPNLSRGQQVADKLPVPGKALSERNDTSDLRDPDWDSHGHAGAGLNAGGNASEIYIGMAPGADHMISDVSGTWYDVIASGLQWPVAEGADIMSVQIGGPGFSNTFGEYLRNAHHLGTLPIISSGNGGHGTMSGFAANPHALSVGATDANNNVTGYSSGMHVDTTRDYAHLKEPWWPEEFWQPDISSPGSRVLTASTPPGQGVDVEEDLRGPDGNYTYHGGTSASAPTAAGAAVLIQGASDRDLSPFEIRSALVATATEDPQYELPLDNMTVSPTGFDQRPDRLGAGIPDIQAASDLVARNTGVEGVVYWDGTDATTKNPVTDAYIETEYGSHYITTPTGGFGLPLPPGEHEINVTALGYKDRSITVTVTEDGYVEENIRLEAYSDAAHVFDVPDRINPGESMEGDTYTTRMDVVNLQELELTLTDESTVDPDDVTVVVENERVELGEPTQFGHPHPKDFHPMTITAIPDADTGGETLGLNVTLRSFGNYAMAEAEQHITLQTAQIESPIRIADGAELPEHALAGESISTMLDTYELNELSIDLTDESTISSESVDLIVNGERTELGETLPEDTVVGEVPMVDLPEDVIEGPASVDTEPVRHERPSDGAGDQKTIRALVAADEPLVGGESSELHLRIHETGTHTPVSDETVTLEGPGIDVTEAVGADGTITVEVSPEQSGEVTVTVDALDANYSTTIPVHSEAPGIHEVPTDYESIKQAVQAADDGDIVLVEEGTYDESLVIDKPITVRGAVGHDVVIEDPRDGADEPAVTIDSDGVSFERIDVSAAAGGDGIYVDGPAKQTTVSDLDIETDETAVELVAAEHVTLEGLTIESATYGIIGSNGHNLTITDTHIDSFGSHGMFLGGGSPATDTGFFDGVQSMSISNNHIAGERSPSEVAGIRLGRGSHDSVVANNSIEDVDGWGIRTMYWNIPNTLEFNTITDTEIAISEHFSETFVRNNHIEGVKHAIESTALNHPDDDDAWGEFHVNDNVFLDFENAFYTDHGEVESDAVIFASENLFLVEDSTFVEVEFDEGVSGSFALSVSGVAGPTVSETHLETHEVSVVDLDAPVLQVPGQFDTIGEALETVGDDTEAILVGEGTYEEQLVIEESIDIMASPGADVTLEDPRSPDEVEEHPHEHIAEYEDGTDPLITIDAPNVTLQGIDLEPAEGATGVFVTEPASGVELRDFDVSPAEGELQAGIWTWTPDGDVITGIGIEDAYDGIRGHQGEELTVIDNRISGFSGHGLFIGGGAVSGPGFDYFFDGTTDMLIAHNQLSGPGAEDGSWGVRIGRSSHGTTVQNNTVEDVGLGIRLMFNQDDLTVEQNSIIHAQTGLSEHDTELEAIHNEIRHVETGFETTSHEPIEDGGREIEVHNNVFEDFEVAFDVAADEVDENFVLPAENNFYLDDTGEAIEEFTDEQIVGNAEVTWEPVLTEAPAPLGVESTIRGVVERPPAIQSGDTVTLVVTVHEMGSHLAKPGADVTITGPGIEQSATTDENGEAVIAITPIESGEITIAVESDDETDQITIETNAQPLSERYDTTGDGEVDLQGLMQAIDDWNQSELDDDSLQEVVSLWTTI